MKAWYNQCEMTKQDKALALFKEKRQGGKHRGREVGGGKRM